MRMIFKIGGGSVPTRRLRAQTTEHIAYAFQLVLIFEDSGEGLLPALIMSVRLYLRLLGESDKSNNDARLQRPGRLRYSPPVSGFISGIVRRTTTAKVG
jgi:hypothetical protein